MSDAAPVQLSSIPLFAGLPEADLNSLRQMLRPIRLAAGEVLYHSGDEGDALYIIQSGQVKVFLDCAAEGDDLVLDIRGPGGVLGLLSILDNRVRTATTQAVEDSELVALDRAPFVAYLREHGEMALSVIGTLTARLRQTVVHAETVATHDSTQRLANVLLFLAERDGRIEPGLITSSLRIKDVALSIGTSEEWVSQTLYDWNCGGIIGMTGPRRIILHDVEALKALSDRED